MNAAYITSLILFILGCSRESVRAAERSEEVQLPARHVYVDANQGEEGRTPQTERPEAGRAVHSQVSMIL